MGFQIGELSRQTGCEIVTIRYYEKEGLLPPPARSSGNFRLYRGEHVERLRFIRHCRSLDMPLDEIRTLLNLRGQPSQDCGEVSALLQAHIEQLESRIAALSDLKRHLVGLQSQCSGARPIGACGILQGLTQCACTAPDCAKPSRGR